MSAASRRISGSSQWKRELIISSTFPRVGGGGNEVDPFGIVPLSEAAARNALEKIPGARVAVVKPPMHPRNLRRFISQHSDHMNLAVEEKHRSFGATDIIR
jgi:hypothetical protein